MNTNLSFKRKFGRLLTNLLSIFAVLVIALPVTQVAYAVSASPFVGHWQATDVDGSDIRLSIGGPPSGPFQITWTEDYISFCDGEAGIVRGTGQLNESDPNLLEAELHLECLTSGNSMDFHFAWRYHPMTGTLSSRYDNGTVILWRQPGKPVSPALTLNLRVNYGHDWVESFYEGGHVAWVTVTESDGMTVRATAELVTEPKDYWGGETGFQSLDSAWLDPDGNTMESAPDIQPGDWVFGWVDNGASAQVQIGEIGGMVDLDANSIQGTILAPWFADPVQVGCLDWGSGREPPYENADAGPILSNGQDPYSCGWAEWDIRPGQTVGVGYHGPDGHWVANAFSAPYPRIVASEAGDWFWVTGFYPGLLDLTIYESAADNAPLLWSGQQEAMDLWGITVVDHTVHGQDLLPGNYLVVSDGLNEKGLVLETITIEAFDPDSEIMAGSAPADREVWAMAGPQDWQQPLMVRANSGDGAWLADFKTLPEPFDITEDMRPWSYAHIYDEDGDANEGSTPPLLVTSLVTGTEDVIADDGICTLREAIIAANTNSRSGARENECPAGQDSQTDTIVLAADQVYSLTIDSTCEDDQVCGDLDIWNNSADTDLIMIVDGNGSATISQDAAVDDRVLENHGATVQIDGVTLTGGSNVWSGGGIQNYGTVTMNNSSISGNAASVHGGGVWNEGTLTLTNSTLADNAASAAGGGIHNLGSLTIENSTLTGNSAGQGGALYNTEHGTAVIYQSHVSDGTASDGGGGLFNLGTMTVENSSVTGNSAIYGGGLFNWVGGMLTINNSAVSGNSANQGGGLHNKEGSTAIIQNGSIFSDNFAHWSGAGIDNNGTITITGSVLRGNTSPGVGDALRSFSETVDATKITASCIVGNGDTAVFNELSASQNATGNWWGDASGPGGAGPGTGDSVSEFVDFSGWLMEPPAICVP